jgi:thiosulfate reductase cytochrome b subunit
MPQKGGVWISGFSRAHSVTRDHAVLIGLSIWKPLQLAWLSGLFGGYPLARNIHLAMMFCIIAFLALHLLLVAIYPRTLVSMVASTKAEEKQ